MSPSSGSRTGRSTALEAALEAYLAQRRALGFQLLEEERHARRFLEDVPTYPSGTRPDTT